MRVPPVEKSVPIGGGSARRSLSAALWVRRPRGTCSPIWNGIGSGKALKLHPPHGWSPSHLRRIILPERSSLFKAHWSNQWVTTMSYARKVKRLEWNKPALVLPRW